MCVCVCVCAVVVVGGVVAVVACTESGKHTHLRGSTVEAIHKYHYAALSPLYLNPVSCISL